MIIYVVIWSKESSSGAFSVGGYSAPQSKTFGTREKAEEYVDKLINAGHMLGVSVDPRINEQVIE